MKRRVEEFSLFKVPSSLNAFFSVCERIQRDWNYQPYKTNEELMSLIRNEDGTSKHFPRRSALAIQPAQINIPPSDESDSVGMIYQVKMARYGSPFGYGPKTWYINNEILIVVRKNGETSLCVREDVEKGVFTPLENFKVEEFLNQPSGSLHQTEESQVKIFNFNFK